MATRDNAINLPRSYVQEFRKACEASVGHYSYLDLPDGSYVGRVRKTWFAKTRKGDGYLFIVEMEVHKPAEYRGTIVQSRLYLGEPVKTMRFLQMTFDKIDLSIEDIAELEELGQTILGWLLHFELERRNGYVNADITGRAGRRPPDRPGAGDDVVAPQDEGPDDFAEEAYDEDPDADYVDEVGDGDADLDEADYE